MTCTKTGSKNNLFLNCRRKPKELSKKELSNVAPASILLLCRCLITTIHYNNFLQVFFILLFIYVQQNRIQCCFLGFKLYFLTASSYNLGQYPMQTFLSESVSLNASFNRRLFYCFKYSWIDKIKIIDNQLSKDGTRNTTMCLFFQPITEKMHFLLFLHMHAKLVDQV